MPAWQETPNRFLLGSKEDSSQYVGWGELAVGLARPKGEMLDEAQPRGAKGWETARDPWNH